MEKIKQLEKEIEKLSEQIKTIRVKMVEEICRCEMHITGTDIGVDFYFQPLTNEIAKVILSHLRKKLNHYQSELYWEKQKEEDKRNKGE